MEDVFRLFQDRRDSLRQLKLLLRSAIESESAKAIIIIDELDRCRPDYAISYLETLKHIFDIHGLIVVLAMDRNQIENSARALFGQSLDADEYLRKFITRQFVLPFPKHDQLERLISDLSKKFTSLDQIRKTSLVSGFSVQRVSHLCAAFELTLRQIEELFRIVGYVFSVEKSKNLEASRPTIDALLFLCAIKLKDRRFFRAMVREEVTTESFVKRLIEAKVSKSECVYWGTVFHVGGLKRRGEQSLQNTMSALELVSAPRNQAPSELEEAIMREWAYPDKNYIVEFTKLIEQATTLFS